MRPTLLPYSVVYEEHTLLLRQRFAGRRRLR
jgi:hypothetical protein